MKHKFVVSPILGLLLAMIPLNVATGQELTKSAKGDLLTNQRATETDEDELPESNMERGRSPFRTINGRKNNDRHKRWGSANILFYRELPAVYGPGDPNHELNGASRPSARAISNLVIDEPVTQFTERDVSSFWYQWGQFLDHDMTLTPSGGTESVPIPLPPDEMIFTEDIPFIRSAFRLNHSKREQFNLNTAFIDGSMVYGSSTERALWLRTLVDGKLKTSSGDLLPYNTIDGEYSGDIDPDAPSMDNDEGGTVKVFVAGDTRASENPVLTSLHILFVREHNRICDRLIGEGETDDERIYQLARKEVGALIQAITYQDFLPAFGIQLRQYSGYDKRTRPDIMNTFATASFRLGHSLVSRDLIIVDDNCEAVGPGEIDLLETFFNPQLVIDYGIDAFLKGATVHDLLQTDTKINDVLRNFLFGDPSDPVRLGLDLGSINIQRGRDHGMPDYNKVRKYYTGRAARSFRQITSNDTLADNLEILYEDVDDIDLWIGILAEDHLQGKSVGKTMHQMLKKQFEKLRDGDYYFYLHDPFLDPSVLQDVKNTTLSDIIVRNTTLTNMPENVFITDHCFEGEEEEETVAARVVSNDVAYPNPFSDVLNIKLEGSELSNFTMIYLYSLDGNLKETVVRKNKQQAQAEVQINTASLKDGIYVVKIVSGNGESRHFKVIKSQQ